MERELLSGWEELLMRDGERLTTGGSQAPEMDNEQAALTGLQRAGREVRTESEAGFREVRFQEHARSPPLPPPASPTRTPAGAVWAGRGGVELPVPRPHLSTMKAEALWLTEAECSAHRPPGSSRVCTV